MTKYDVYATIAVQIEAETPEKARIGAECLPLEYWDDTSLDITEVVGHAD